MKKRMGLWLALLSMTVLSLVGVGRADIDLSSAAAGAGTAVWGGITGTLSGQTDLQTEVNTKMEEPAGNGIAVRTGNDTSINRTVTSSDGSNIVSNGDGTGGNIDIVVDTAVFPRYSSGTGDVPATGAVGTFYAETDANSFYTYPSTDTEHWLLSAAAGTTIGDFFYVSAVDVLTAINGTDGNLITWSADDVPALVTTGASGNVLVSGGAGVAPTFTDMPYTSLADGTDGNLITWGADGAPALVATGTATHVLTSNGADTAPTFQAAAAGGSGNLYTWASNLNAGTVASGNTAYFTLVILTGSTEDIRSWHAMQGCTAKNLYVRTGATQPATGNLVLTLRDDGSSTQLVVTVAAGAAAGVYSDAVNTPTIDAGSNLSLQITNNSEAASATLRDWGLECY